MRLVSWNINGLRAALNRGLWRWMGRSGADVVALQEIRARTEDLPASVHTPRGWHADFASATRRGYSGVALFARRPFTPEPTRLPRRFEIEGRVQLARIGALLVANAYFPNGNGVDRDNSRIPYKLAFYRALFRRLRPAFEAGAPILVVGDFNTAHGDVDLARPRDNHRTSGFTPVERRELDRWLRAGWVDTFRHFEPGGGHYTWWPNRNGCRARNIGWRLDLVLASPGALPFVQRAFIQRRVLGSDHCPVGVDLDDRVLASGAAG